jgi:hypothetical protein
VEYFEIWDGSFTEGAKAAAVRLHLTIENAVSFEQEIQFGARLRFSELPEDDESIDISAANRTFHCNYECGDWSTPLRDEHNCHLPEHCDLAKPLTLTLGTRSWRSPASQIYLFHRVPEINVPVSCDALERNLAAWILVAESAASEIIQWGKRGSNCEEWRDRSAWGGVPKGFSLFYAEKVLDDSQIRCRFPTLSFRHVKRIRLIGGIQLEQRRYAAFSLPRVCVSGYEARRHELQVNGVPLKTNEDGNAQITGFSADATIRLTLHDIQANEILDVHQLRTAASSKWPPDIGTLIDQPPIDVSSIPSNVMKYFRLADLVPIVEDQQIAFEQTQSEERRQASAHENSPSATEMEPEDSPNAVTAAEQDSERVSVSVREWASILRTAEDQEFCRATRLYRMLGPAVLDLTFAAIIYRRAALNSKLPELKQAAARFLSIARSFENPTLSAVASMFGIVAQLRRGGDVKGFPKQQTPAPFGFERVCILYEAIRQEKIVELSSRPIGISFAELSPVDDDARIESQYLTINESPHE